jgi:uncharacterized protein (TIGR00255 family)
MTGFGKGQAVNHDLGIGFSVEISSVNRKQLEIRASLPHEISAFELDLRQVIKQKIARGTIMARVNMTLEENQSLNTLKINRPLLEKLAKECSEVSEKFNRSSWSVAELMSLPGVMETSTPDMEKAEIKSLFIQAVKIALDKLLTMRKAEGEALCKDLKERCGELIVLTDKLEPLLKKVPSALKEKLLERLENEDLAIGDNDERMLKELIFYVDRSDVSEELIRLRSHFAQMEKFLNTKDNAVGRSMDFLMQEMFREVTTFGNKAASCEITPLIVEFKTGLEKIREQIQNIE